MPTPCEISGVRPPAISGAVAPVASSVADDLAAIFPREARATAAPTLRLRARSGRRDGAARKRTSVGYAGGLGALAAATLAGVSAGALLERGPSPPPPMAQPVLQSKVSALPSPGPLPAGPMHAPPPRLMAAAAEPTGAPPAKVHKASTRRPAASQRRHAAGAAHRTNCPGGRCHAPSVMEADARLRHAYAEARRAGVSSTVLADYRDRWEELRHRAPREPRLVAARYDAMAGDLNRMAARHEVEQERTPGRVGPWRALKTQIAALWR